MKVLLLNGSPRGNKCTRTALEIVASEINKENIETEIFDIGSDPIRGCIGCGGCIKKGKCVFDNDGINIFVEKMNESDALIVGSPVHYAAASGAVTSFLDRAFYSGKSAFEYKPAASVVSCRRGGATATFDQINKYFSISNMPVISSNYWNMIHGNCPEEILKDEEGVQTMQILGKNTAWLLKCIKAGKEKGIDIPEREAKIKTNYIR